MTDSPARALETRLIHAGEPSPRIAGAVVMPVFQTAMYEYRGGGEYHDIPYIRLNNTPNHKAVQEKLAAIEGGEAALVTASGMAAISTTLLALLRAGDHVLAQGCLYGGTRTFLESRLPRFGISVDFLDMDDPGAWASAARETTRVVYVESMTNPLLEVTDLDAVVAFARARGLISVVDNTLATPVNLRPLARGVDLSLHSATKYLNGHSDIVAGAVIGARRHVARVKHLLDHTGGSLDPHACALLHRGLKTLALRVRAQGEGALALARALQEHPAVARVHYPGLPQHPHHARARALLEGCGGLLSFELRGGAAAAERLLERLELPIVAPSLGGVETLITRPAVTSHAGVDPETRARLGISDGLVRVSVGIERPGDLVADFQAALAEL